MAYKKNDKNKTKQDKVHEREAVYKTIRVFNSFEEANEYTAKERAALSYDERLQHIEILRKQVFGEYLSSNGTWPPISKTFKIMKPYTNDPGKQL